eukprot:1344879-Amorphochlora_amoeboformis.AAC.2
MFRVSGVFEDVDDKKEYDCSDDELIATSMTMGLGRGEITEEEVTASIIPLLYGSVWYTKRHRFYIKRFDREAALRVAAGGGEAVEQEQDEMDSDAEFEALLEGPNLNSIESKLPEDLKVRWNNYMGFLDDIQGDIKEAE